MVCLTAFPLLTSLRVVLWLRIQTMLAHVPLVLRENVYSGWVGCHQCQDQEKVVESAEVYYILADFLPAGPVVLEK